MQQKILKHTGDRTSPAQRRINRANSLDSFPKTGRPRIVKLGFPHAV